MGRMALLQLLILRLGFLQNGYIWVGVFPEAKEIFVGGSGFGCVAGKGIGATELDVGKCTDGFVEHNPAMV